MVKLNLLDNPEEEKPSNRQDRPEQGDDETRSEIDFSFFKSEDEDPTADMESMRREEATTPPPPPPPTPEAASHRRVVFEDPPIEDSSGPKWLWIGGGAVLLLLAAFALYYFGVFGASDETAAELPAETAEPVAEPQNLLPPPLQQRYAENQGRNLFYLDHASNLLGAAPSGVSYTLFVVTAGNIYVSVVADARDDISRFRRAMSSQFPDLELKAANDGSYNVSGKSMVSSDFTIPIQRRVPPASGRQYSELPPQDIPGALRSMATRHNLSQPKISRGNQSRAGGLSSTAYYVDINGGRASVLAYLKDMARTYPGVGFTKISLYPARTASFSDGKVKAHLELTVSTG